MSALLTVPAASALLVVDEMDAATLTEIARATGRPMSTIQRAVEGLIRANVLVRDAPRGRVRLNPGAPRRALRELAEWRVGRRDSAAIRSNVHTNTAEAWMLPPPTISDAKVRAAWPSLMRAIEEEFDPERVILFGSQARGDADPDSDVDLLVVFDREIDRHELRVRILKALSRAPFAKDVLVASTDDLAQPMAGTAFATAVHDGVVVYER